MRYLLSRIAIQWTCWSGERRKPGKYPNADLFVLFLVLICNIRLKDVAELSLSRLCLIHPYVLEQAAWGGCAISTLKKSELHCNDWTASSNIEVGPALTEWWYQVTPRGLFHSKILWHSVLQWSLFCLCSSSLAASCRRDQLLPLFPWRVMCFVLFAEVVVTPLH